MVLNNEGDARFRSVLTEQGDMSNLSSHTVQRPVTLNGKNTYLAVVEARGVIVQSRTD